MKYRDTAVSCAKTAEPIQKPFWIGSWDLGGPKEMY